MLARRDVIKVCSFPSYVPINEGIGIMSAALARTGEVEIFNYDYFTSFFRKADLFHVHFPDVTVDNVRWPRHVIKVVLFLLYVLLCKALRRPIVWTVHNVGAHEFNSTWSERVLWAVFLPRVDCTIHLCSASFEALHRLTKTPPPGTLIPHANYRSVYSVVPTAEARASLGLAPDRFVISSFGLLRPYKGFEHLIKVFREWDCADANLRIAGEPMFKTIETELIEQSKGDNRISIVPRALAKDDLRDLICASDVIAIPYTKILNSGVANVALTLNRPIIAPAAGCILDYDKRLGPRWVYMFEKELTVDDLRRAHEAFRNRDHDEAPDLEWMDPDRVAAEILQVYRQVLQAPAT